MFFYRMPNGDLVNLRHVVRIETPSATTIVLHFVTGPPAITYTVDVTDLKDVLSQVKLIVEGK